MQYTHHPLIFMTKRRHLVESVGARDVYPGTRIPQQQKRGRKTKNIN
jgi:hypothetical protein